MKLMYKEEVNFDEPKEKDVIEFLKIIHKDLEDLQLRLVLDYNGDKDFEQTEEDRLVLGNLLDLLDNLKGFYIRK